MKWADDPWKSNDCLVKIKSNTWKLHGSLYHRYKEPMKTLWILCYIYGNISTWKHHESITLSYNDNGNIKKPVKIIMYTYYSN